MAPNLPLKWVEKANSGASSTYAGVWTRGFKLFAVDGWTQVHRVQVACPFRGSSQMGKRERERERERETVFSIWFYTPGAPMLMGKRVLRNLSPRIQRRRLTDGIRDVELSMGCRLARSPSV